MNILRKVITSQEKENLDIRNNQKEIDSTNKRMLYTMLSVGCVAFAIFFVWSFFLETLKGLTGIYGIMLIFVLIYTLMCRWLLKRIRVVWLIYAGYGITILYSTYSSAFITPDFVCVVILFFLFQLPIVIIDVSWRINLFECCYALLYVVCAVPFKNSILIADEILNCMLFTSVAVVLGVHMRKARIENFELNRQALLRENVDYLTGLGNRKKLMTDLSRFGNLLDITVIMLDIDNFKMYNDTYGHQEGDECLKKICAFLDRFGEKNQTCFYRYGGEEFVGIVKKDAVSTLALCKRLNKAVCDLRIPHKAVDNGFVTISIGISDDSVIQSSNYEKLLTQADIALYRAKSNGKNTSVKFDPSMGKLKDMRLLIPHEE